MAAVEMPDTCDREGGRSSEDGTGLHGIPEESKTKSRTSLSRREVCAERFVSFRNQGHDEEGVRGTQGLRNV